MLEAPASLDPARLHPHGRHALKVEPSAHDVPRGQLVLVSAMTPTAAGAGKTTVSIGLTDGLRHLGVDAAAALREPSMGPVFGRKGGGTGGGRARLVPDEDIDLHFTGDLHAVTAAHNLLAMLVDDHLHRGNALRLEPRTVLWPRAVDLDDRALRHVVVGLGGRADGVPRETGFVITAASEVMAILCLATDAEDLRARLARVVVGRSHPHGEAVTAGDLRADGAMARLLRQALWPNLVRTAEGSPAWVHGGPFANIAQGTNSVIATRTALAHHDVVVTEAGFGFDLGGEKWLDLIRPVAGVSPQAIVLVATCRALRAHGSGDDLGALTRGLDNLAHHLTVARRTGVPVVLTVNRHAGDDDKDLARVRAFADENGAPFAVFEGFARGPEGSVDLATAVREALAGGAHEAEARRAQGFQVPGDDARANLERVSREVYGADHVVFTPSAERDWRAVEALGLTQRPVCVAKTPASLTDDASRVGRPTGFPITVDQWRIAAGAGFLVAVSGGIALMPGLPKGAAVFDMGA